MYLLQIFYLFLPAGIGNLVPPFAAIFLPQYNQPLDFNRTFRGKRILGSHKTIRGIILGLIGGELMFLLQRALFTVPFFHNLSLIDYTTFPIYFGAFAALGSLTGDAVKSFFKRQSNIKPGSSWFPWDQIDWVIGSFIVSTFFIQPTLKAFAAYLFAGLVVHLVTKVIGYFIKVNDTLI